MSIEQVIKYTNRRIKEDDIQLMNLFGEAKSEMIKFNMPNVNDFTLNEKIKKRKNI